MATEKYYSVCDFCKKESSEYVAFAWCQQCGKDMCPSCTSEDYDSETGRGTCKTCNVPESFAEQKEGV